jgi:drug/metabolite transporter (DMT)-like permease
MTWQLFLLISIFSSSLKGILFRVLMRQVNSDPKAQSIAFLSISGVLALLVALIRGFRFPTLPLLLPNFMAMIFLLTLAPLFIFRALQLTGASDVAIFLSSQWLWTVLGSFVFLGERATLLKIAGTVFLLSGVVLISWEKHKIEIKKGELFALLAGLLYGLSYVNGFYILQSLDAFSFAVYASFLPAATLVIAQPSTIKRLKFYTSLKNAINVFTTALLDTIATISFYLAYQVGRNASQISPLSATPVMLTIIFSAIFLKERENLLKKIAGSAIIVSGVALIMW